MKTIIIISVFLVRIFCLILLGISVKATNNTTNQSQPQQQQQQQPRIIDGISTPNDSIGHSFYIRSGFDLQSSTTIPYCGATLIHDDILITAAHCQGNFNYGLMVYDIETGKYSQVNSKRQMTIDLQHRHPKWNYNNRALNYDILLMRLSTPIDPTTDPILKPIPINTNPDEPIPWDQLKIYGFGFTHQGIPSSLQEATVRYINNIDCQARIESSGLIQNLPAIPNDVLCTTTDPSFGSTLTSTCNGDSGGPLTTLHGTKLVGVISFAVQCTAEPIPNGYVRISTVATWIQEQICIMSRIPPSSCPTLSAAATVDTTNRIEIELIFIHDYYAEDTTYSIRSVIDQSIVYDGPKYVPVRNGRHKVQLYLQPGKYTFEVYDKGDDGMLSQRGNSNGDGGRWKISAFYDDSNGQPSKTVLASGNGNYTNQQITEFEVMQSSPSSTLTVNTEEMMDDCLLLKTQEESYGILYGTSCECMSKKDDDDNKIQLDCINSNNTPCSIEYGYCNVSSVCCSGRRCLDGICRSIPTTTTTTTGGASKDNSRLGNEMGGSAGRRRRRRHSGGIRRQQTLINDLDEADLRIISGEIADPSLVTFFAKAAGDGLDWTPDQVCGASLIYSDILVSAAHCQGAFNYGILLYDSETNDFTRKVSIDRQSRHPVWNANNNAWNYDLFVMRLTTPISSTDIVRPISINLDVDIPSQQQPLKAFGFGLINTNGTSSSSNLRQANVQYIPNDECRDLFSLYGNVDLPVLPEEFLCTGPNELEDDTVSVCQGDSGGPVTNRDATTLVGIISFGIGCSSNKVPNFHVRVSAASDWIREQICLLSNDPPKDCVFADSAKANSTLVKVTLTFVYDFDAQETTYAIRSKADNSIVYSGPDYVPARNEMKESTLYLPYGNYTFEVYDSTGNGLWDKDEIDEKHGWWKLVALYDGHIEKALAQGDHKFSDVQTTDFTITNLVEVMDIDQCISVKAREEAYGASYGTECSCNYTQDRHIQLICTNRQIEECAAESFFCASSTACCSNRICHDGYCTSSRQQEMNKKDDSRLNPNSEHKRNSGRGKRNTIRGR